MGTMRILDSSGDTLVDWRVDDLESIQRAEDLFGQLKSLRKIPFARAAGAPASECTQVREFVPDAEEIIWVRPIQGG